MTDLIDTMRRFGACEPALRWAESLPAGTTLEDAWAACPHGEWLLRAARAVGLHVWLLVDASLDCAEAVLPRLPAWDDRPRAAVAAARRVMTLIASEGEKEYADWAATQAATVGYEFADYAVAAARAAARFDDAVCGVDGAISEMADDAAHLACHTLGEVVGEYERTGQPNGASVVADTIRAKIPWYLVEDRLSGVKGSRATAAA